MITIYCDRCKADQADHPRLFVEGTIGIGRRLIHLCDPCADTLDHWLAGE